jgi:hypothetical protein
LKTSSVRGGGLEPPRLTAPEPKPGNDNGKPLEIEDSWRHEAPENDHVDPSKKTSHSIWSWSPERREAEIAKCQVLCRPCHQLKSIDDLAAMRLAGRKVVSTKLTEDDVRAIRAEAARGVSLRTLGMRFGVDKTAIHKVVARKRWRHVA